MTHRTAGARLPGIGLGLFAILFQAILFGWHHHEVRLAGHLPLPVVENPGTAQQTGDNDADGCEICQVLHHLAAAPLEIFAAPLPLLVGDAAIAESKIICFPASARAFLARGPPLA